MGTVRTLLADLNGRPLKKLPGCQASATATLDRPLLKPLPAARMSFARFNRARVNIDDHAELEGHYYSVPHRLVREQVEHAYKDRRGAHATDHAHTPTSHRVHRGLGAGQVNHLG